MNGNKNTAYQTQSTNSTKEKVIALHVYIFKIKITDLSF